MSADPRLAEARRFEAAIQDRCSSRAVPFRWGMGLFHEEVRHVWDFNFLRVEPNDDVTADALAAVAEELMGPIGCDHRRVVVDDETMGHRLADGFRALRWDVNRLAVMAHDGSELPSERPEVVRLDLAEYQRARRIFFSREPWGRDEKVLRQMDRRIEITAGAIETSTFAAIVDDQIVSVCETYQEGGVAQVEDVATLEEYRGRGLAKGVVTRATKDALAAGNQLVFLVADADDWPRELYSALGFAEVGIGYAYLLTKV